MQIGETLDDFHVVTKLGVFEQLVASENDVHDITHNNFDISKRKLLIFQKYFSQRYLIEPMIVNDEDIVRLKKNSSGNGVVPNDETDENIELDDLDATEVPSTVDDEDETNKDQIIKVGESVLFKKTTDDKGDADLRSVFDRLFISIKNSKKPKTYNSMARLAIKATISKEIKKSLPTSLLEKVNIVKEQFVDLDRFSQTIENNDFDINLISLFVIELMCSVKFIIVDDGSATI